MPLERATRREATDLGQIRATVHYLKQAARDLCDLCPLI